MRSSRDGSSGVTSKDDIDESKLMDNDGEFGTDIVSGGMQIEPV